MNKISCKLRYIHRIKNFSFSFWTCTLKALFVIVYEKDKSHEVSKNMHWIAGIEDIHTWSYQCNVWLTGCQKLLWLGGLRYHQIKTLNENFPRIHQNFHKKNCNYRLLQMQHSKCHDLSNIPQAYTAWEIYNNLE